MAKESQISLLDHSSAKVNLYGKYLSIYLNVLARSRIENIYLFDLFCGEGVYKDGGKGSPVVALECIKNHYYSNNETCPNLFITFNDSGESEIEVGRLKIERVREFASKIFCPKNVQIGYSKIDYNKLIPKVIERIALLKGNERALIFIDPWGYKEIDPADIKMLMQNGKTEVILFLPIYFMSRFANKSKDLDFKGGKALRNFMGKLFGTTENIPHIDGQKEFIYIIQQQFKSYMGLKYVDSFKIERERGDGFKIGDEVKIELFDELEVSGYQDKILNYLLQNKGVTNINLFDFGLENNFLPKHTKTVLDELKKKYNFEIISLDEKPAISYYLGDEKRLVNIKIKS